MAVLEDLIAKIADQSLRGQIEAAVADLKRRKRFGLVFEEHIPEITALLGLPMQPGALVQRRDGLNDGQTYRVVRVDSQDTVTVEPSDGSSETEQIRTGDLLVVKRFGEPIYPALESVGSVRLGGDTRPYHAVIDGENFHALQLFTYLYEGNVDCIYLDPPYNTGARDWKYNNHYVDANDAWRHSKWLSMMEKRLLLVRRLLKPDGVMVVTIDEHEVHHLGMLLERLFPDAARQMVTIVITPSGIEQGRLSRVEEYAFFCFFGNADKPLGFGDDFLQDESKVRTASTPVAWESLLRRGASSARADRPTMFYPVLIDPDARRIVGVGEPILEGDPDPTALIDGRSAAWPIRTTGDWGRWRVGAPTLRQLIASGYVRVGGYDTRRKTWTLS